MSAASPRAQQQQQQQASPYGEGGGGGGGGLLLDSQKAAIRQLLKDYGTPDRTGAGVRELRVPNEHLQIVSSQATTLTGQPAPRQPLAKRVWLADLARESGLA